MRLSITLPVLRLFFLSIWTYTATANGSLVHRQSDNSAVSILEDITTDVLALNYLLSRYESGDSVSTLESGFRDVISAVETGASVLEDLPGISISEATSLGDAAESLQLQISLASDTIITLKPRLVQAGDAGTIKARLEEFDEAATGLMAVFVSKFPDELDVSAAFLDTIIDPIAEAVEAYEDVEADSSSIQSETASDDDGADSGQVPLVLYWNTF
ncbi:hypothetical protein BJX66DRAFT_301833 [Aspergillus keveii]|uniref:Antigenic cell wall galactomannoprotein n=1 Tax=Aspergillus keveii TaxID=714993 RepID=A0ABR4G933_9EURO